MRKYARPFHWQCSPRARTITLKSIMPPPSRPPITLPRLRPKPMMLLAVLRRPARLPVLSVLSFVLPASVHALCWRFGAAPILRVGLAAAAVSVAALALSLPRLISHAPDRWPLLRRETGSLVRSLVRSKAYHPILPEPLSDGDHTRSHSLSQKSRQHVRLLRERWYQRARTDDG